jgi:hypothetical protein
MSTPPFERAAYRDEIDPSQLEAYLRRGRALQAQAVRQGFRNLWRLVWRAGTAWRMQRLLAPEAAEQGSRATGREASRRDHSIPGFIRQA